jgi:hypothetical protein
VSRTLIESDATLKFDPSQKGTWSAHGCNEMDVMSALGQKQTSKRSQRMSALPPKADIVHGGGNVRFVPRADVSADAANERAPMRLLYHLVGE